MLNSPSVDAIKELKKNENLNARSMGMCCETYGKMVREEDRWQSWKVSEGSRIKELNLEFI